MKTHFFSDQINKKPGMSGFTVIEIMIVVSIITISFLGIIAAFTAISTVIQSTKFRTLATNLAQEKMEILKHVSYNRLMITAVPSYKTELSPPIPFDNSYYRPERIHEGGVSFERLTYVQMATEVDGDIIYFGATPVDTGMKAITVTVLWRMGNEYRKVQLKSLTTNLDTTALSAAITGSVSNSATGWPINDASVMVSENVAWLDMTDFNGRFNMNVQRGEYNLVASADGFFSQSIPISIPGGQITTQNFSLRPMSSGTVIGTAWLNNHLVISQVVGSSVNAAGFDQEYVELFNPTTYTWQIASDPVTGIIGIRYKSTSDPDADPPRAIVLDYITMAIPPMSYYLMANTTTVMFAGASINADAVWSSVNPGYPNVIRTRQDSNTASAGGGAGIYYISDNTWIDRVGWNRGAEGGPREPPLREGAGILQPMIGFERGEQFVRRTSTSSTIAPGLANAYDFDNNRDDWLEIRPITWPPRNSLSTATVVSGSPAVGAVISSDDGLSHSVTASIRGAIPYAEFILTRVATGTWNVSITSGMNTMMVSPVVVAAHEQVVRIPSATTIPAWPAAGFNVVLLSNTADGGYISGRVTRVGGHAISPSIRVRAGLAGSDFFASASDGRYMIPVSTGVYTVIANPNNINSQFVSQTQDNVVVNLGQIASDINFILSQGGRIRGRVMRDILNPLPDISVVAMDSMGTVRAQTVSGADGNFLLINLSTGVYTVEPVLDSKEVSSPIRSTTTVTVGANIFAGTFTVTGAFGRIAGNVSALGRPISTGVLIVASTAPFSTSAPPAISSQTASGAPYYMANSREDGSYILEVRGGAAPYRVVAFYPRMFGGSILTSTATITGVSVLSGVTTNNINFSW